MNAIMEAKGEVKVTEYETTDRGLQVRPEELRERHAALEEEVARVRSQASRRKATKLITRKLKREKERVRTIEPDLEALERMVQAVSDPDAEPRRAQLGRIRLKANNIVMALKAREQSLRSLEAEIEKNAPQAPADLLRPVRLID